MSMQNACWLLPSRAYRSLCVEHRADVETEAVVGAHGERLEVGVGEEVVEGDGALGRRVLEERVVECHGRELVDRDSRSASASAASSVALPLGERRRGGAVDVVERGEQAVLVELAGRQREREVVAVAERAARPGCASRASSRMRSATSAPICFDASHAARRVVDVVAGAQDLGDRVVVDAPAVDLAPEVVERRLDARPRARRSRGAGRPAPGGARRRRGARRAGGGAAGRLVSLPARRFDGAEPSGSARNSRRSSSTAVAALRRGR